MVFRLARSMGACTLSSRGSNWRRRGSFCGRRTIWETQLRIATSAARAAGCRRRRAREGVVAVAAARCGRRRRASATSGRRCAHRGWCITVRGYCTLLHRRSSRLSSILYGTGSGSNRTQPHPRPPSWLLLLRKQKQMGRGRRKPPLFLKPEMWAAWVRALEAHGCARRRLRGSVTRCSLLQLRRQSVRLCLLFLSRAVFSPQLEAWRRVVESCSS